MNTYTAKCDICGTENTVASYGDWACRQCGQGYTYDECHQIRLTDSQWALLRNPPRWIPVSERLPDDENDVLVRYRYGHKTVCVVAYRVSGNDCWTMSVGDCFDFSDEQATHWMPLPDAPEVK